MTWEEYLVYPRKLGWKHEYFGGALHLSPAWTAVATFQLSLSELLNREVYTCVRRSPVASIRPLQPQDLDALLTLFCACFEKSIEYVGSGPEGLMRYAHRTLDRFFGQSTAPHRKGCRVAVVKKKYRWLLDDYRRGTWCHTSAYLCCSEGAAPRHCHFVTGCVSQVFSGPWDFRTPQCSRTTSTLAAILGSSMVAHKCRHPLLGTSCHFRCQMRPQLTSPRSNRMLNHDEGNFSKPIVILASCSDVGFARGSLNTFAIADFPVFLS